MAAARISFSSTSRTSYYRHSPFLGPKPTPTTPSVYPITPFSPNLGSILRCRRRPSFTVCFVLEDDKFKTQFEAGEEDIEMKIEEQISATRLAEKLARKKSERFTYLVAAVMSSFGITSMAVMAVYYRFYWQMEGGEVPFSEMFGTFALSVGAAVGMEFWARWAHKALWHASLWHMHEGLGITVFGMAYMFVHDGLVHKRFPVGPVANVPYLRKVAAAHSLHHSEKFNGVPYGLFLGPKELEEVGGLEELEKEVNRRTRYIKGS
ncbi:beta-carotene hydroxylase 2, chloroplastic isoform X1 [Capsicum annuum]|uniref:beta-carotene hydroxylase 2, chloroplastic isoform X1 n=1 Tax=Capsicum annuum TaxID=4072 RepID=UPI0007BED906|nr:beta-carotene hydroxylase 2, chloroplastic isoform X1 [Capsicum annuum]